MDKSTQSRGLFEVVRHERTAELFLYGSIGHVLNVPGISAKDVIDSISKLPPEIQALRVRIDSLGGNMLESLAIHIALKRFPGPVEIQIDGICASAATLIAMAGDTLTIVERGQFCVHNCWEEFRGGPEQLRAKATTLESLRDWIFIPVYKNRGKSAEEIAAAMDLCVWLRAADALSAGWVDSVISECSRPPIAVVHETVPGTPKKRTPTRRELSDALEPHREVLAKCGWLLVVGDATKFRIAADCLEEILGQRVNSTTRTAPISYASLFQEFDDELEKILGYRVNLEQILDYRVSSANPNSDGSVD